MYDQIKFNDGSKEFCFTAPPEKIANRAKTNIANAPKIPTESLGRKTFGDNVFWL
jgi:hypothetical protein